MSLQSAIFKYALNWEKVNVLKLPKNSEFLCMKLQNGGPTLWYKHNPITNGEITVTIIMRPTGINYESELFPGEDYITTLFTGNEVYHFFFKY